MAKKCIKSALFSCVVRVGLPRFFLPPGLTLISNNAGPFDALSQDIASFNSSSLTTVFACKRETKKV